MRHIHLKLKESTEHVNELMLERGAIFTLIDLIYAKRVLCYFGEMQWQLNLWAIRINILEELLELILFLFLIIIIMELYWLSKIVEKNIYSILENFYKEIIKFHSFYSFTKYLLIIFSWIDKKAVSDSNWVELFLD